MNIKTPVKTGCYNGCTIHNAHGQQIAEAPTPQEATELSAIINLHGELVEKFKDYMRVKTILGKVTKADEALLSGVEKIGKD